MFETKKIQTMDIYVQSDHHTANCYIVAPIQRETNPKETNMIKP